ncbi:hepatitis A virus cellular receptor 1 homolog isoform X2 [Sphaeramia orbicularis]|uniref:hepatitis A virus cellular receptor 1 homolog isoform X2 n=1 Tax=Sphaeramia orbicularis TaxID=375764 RepID=UPI00117C9DA1|nr:hepatitis A virus cellular receptor 1 homolog isoform X2 [Sphaeramia orbicularis]
MFVMKTIGFTLLLAVLTVSECSVQIIGVRGQSVTLPCSYDINHHGGLSVCWGRGDVPNNGCNRLIIALDGQTVRKNTRLSSRYQLLGPLDQGDISLTILNLTDEDAGRYGCRVEVTGWFNDEKYHIDLVIEQAPTLTTSTPPDNETITGQTTVNTTADQLSSSLNPMTSSSVSVQAEESSSSVSVVVMCVVLGVVALVSAGGVVIAAKRWNILKKISQQQQVNTTVQFSATTSALQLRRQSSAVENIYQIDGGEYESCP